MPKIFRLPDIGEGLTEAEIVRWLVAVGGTVEMDQPVVEVETDKAVVEIPSPYAGTVLFHGGGNGEVVMVGSVLVVIGEPGESWPGEPAGSGAAAPIVGSLSEDAVDLTRRIPPTPQIFSRRVAALPVVRKLGRDLGVDLEMITGTGPEGRITREDVVSAAEVLGAASSVSAQSASVEISPAGGTRRPMSRLRRTIAANMSRSWAEIPHVTTFDEVDASRLLAAKSALSSRHGVAVSFDSLVVKAVLPALAAFPDFTAGLDDQELVIPETVAVGVAVDTDEGLMVVVVRDLAARSILELSAEIGRLAESAKARTLKPDELSGQNFTISNIGALGGGFGTPIVPPGTAAILSVGRAKQSTVVRNGSIEIAPMMPLSLSYDHRVIDGGLGRRFMAMVMENLAEPALFLA